MGLISNLDEATEMDKCIGHRRVFGWESFLEIFAKAGLHIHAKGSYWLKPLSDSQIESYWTESMIRAFFKIGERYPDIASNIYVVAKK